MLAFCRCFRCGFRSGCGMVLFCGFLELRRGPSCGAELMRRSPRGARFGFLEIKTKFVG